ncbi:unnamed protein product [Lampetra fluviatilis]
MSPLLLLAALVSVASALLSALWLRRRGPAAAGGPLPPGPRAWPLVGGLPALWWENRKAGGLLHVALEMLARRHGDVMSIATVAGRPPVVVLSGATAVREALGHHPEALAGRPDLPLVRLVTRRKGIVFAPLGATWQRHRRFSHAALRRFGAGLATATATETTGSRSESCSIPSPGPTSPWLLETRVEREVSSLLRTLASRSGGAVAPFSPAPLIHGAVANVICGLCFSRHYHNHDGGDGGGGKDDDQGCAGFRCALRLMVRGMELASNSPAMLINVVPALRFLPCGPFRELFSTVDEVSRFLKGIIREHEETLDPANPRDFIDAFLVESRGGHDDDDEEGGGEAPGGTRGGLDADDLFYIVADLFIAGTDTTANTLLWCLLLMCTYPAVQARVQAELDAVVGRGRRVSLSDRPRLPLTVATIMEVQRLSSVVPLAIPHSATRSVQLRGFTVPQGSVVLLNLWACHVDPRVWARPLLFDPERFLDPHGRLRRRDAFMPFGIGRRSCLGESLARVELFLFFSALMQEFTFTSSAPHSPDSAPQSPVLQGTFGLTYAPPPFTLTAVARAVGEVAT